MRLGGGERVRVVGMHYSDVIMGAITSHQPHRCLLNRLFGRRSKKTSKFCVTGLCVENSPVTSEFHAQMASNAENVSIWWRHYGWVFALGGTARWLQLQPSSAWPRRRKRSKMFSLCTTRKPHDPPGIHLDFRLSLLGLSPCFAGVIWFPYDVIMAKEKCCLDDGCTIFIFSTDDGCTRWWRWLYYLGRVIFDTHSRSREDKYANRLYDCCQVWYV